MGRFDGATVLITGATGGLGSGAAKAFAAEGARLVLSDLDEAHLAISRQHSAPRPRSLPAMLPTRRSRRIW
ncbi:SDR family NAD(P)-dependent oxidoreductase [Mesorhizobium sp. M1C.F.Ca.ET.187.01.1.1]|uniref:SDR family NAD(P)-dependent oxidoreductase n=1 Tax=unclassified Mesorhizobium TaxID=325217 RepID=UPI0026D1538B